MPAARESVFAATLILIVVATQAAHGQETAPEAPVITTTDERSGAWLRDRSPAALQQRQGILGAALSGRSSSGSAAPRQAARISLSLKDADLQEVLRSFARLADVNLILDPAIKGQVTLELHDVPWDQALQVILKSQSLAAELDGRIWRVGS